MNGTQTARVRVASYATALAKATKKLGADYKGVISQGFLRAEAELIDGEGTYLFKFNQSKNGTVTEELLADNDAFFGIAAVISLGVRDANVPSAFVKQFYPNEVVFETETALSPAGTFNARHLEAIYNAGKLNYRKGDTTYLKALSLTPARFVGQTQQTTAANRTSTEFAGNGAINFARVVDLEGTNPGEWYIRIPGANNLKLQYSTAAHVGQKVILTLELYGLLATGGSKILTAANSK